jgi:hypothetical protein
MHHFNSLHATVLLSALLCSCGFMTPSQQYSGEQKALSEIAVIQSHQGSLLGDEYHATISGYAYKIHTVKPVIQHFGLPGFTDYPREIHLNPGSYTLELYCFKSLAKPTFRSTLDVSVKAGYSYKVKCVADEGGVFSVVSQESRTL